MNRLTPAKSSTTINCAHSIVTFAFSIGNKTKKSPFSWGFLIPIKRISYFKNSTFNSTLLLRVLPAAVLLLSTGLDSPYPFADTLNGLTPAFIR